MELAGWTFRLARPDDAIEIAGLVRASYAGSYPELQGGAVDLRRRLTRGDAAYGLAFDPAGKHVGQVALEARGPNSWEHGRAVVAPHCRGRGLMDKMSQLLFQTWVPRRRIPFVFGRSVTNHLRTQRYNESAGFVPLGLLLGVWEHSLSFVGLPAAAQPISALLVGKSFERAPRPRTLRLEGTELERASSVLAALGVRSGAAPCSLERLSVVREVEQGGRLVRLRLTAKEGMRLGRGQVQQEVETGAGVIWADVPAEHPGAPRAIEELKSQGLSWGAFLPRGGVDGEDVVRLQRYVDVHPLRLEDVQVLPGAAALRDAVFAEARGILEPAA